MNLVELPRLYELVREHRCVAALEIGMAHATSSIAIARALVDGGEGRLTSIDPFQSKVTDGGFASQGLRNLETAQLQHVHELIEEPDYFALPKLLQDGKRYDFILIDGYHSFDYTLIDIFFADLLLLDGGLLCIHDSSWPAVYRATQFLEMHKPYELISPRAIPGGQPRVMRAFRKLGMILTGQLAEINERSRRWNTLVCYRKLASQMVPEKICRRF